MSENVESAVLQLLIKLQEELASFRREIDDRFDRMEARLRRIEALQMQAQRDLAAVWLFAAPPDHGKVLS